MFWCKIILFEKLQLVPTTIHLFCKLPGLILLIFLLNYLEPVPLGFCILTLHIQSIHATPADDYANKTSNVLSSSFPATNFGSIFRHSQKYMVVFFSTPIVQFFHKNEQISHQNIQSAHTKITFFCFQSKQIPNDKIFTTGVVQQISGTRSLGALRGPTSTSSWRPFGPLDFVLPALRALRPVCRARLRSGPAFFTIFDHFLPF